MIVRYTARALRDLEAISDYLTHRSPQGARNVRSAIQNTIAQLEQFPNLGRAQSINGVYKLVMSQYPYLVYYGLSIETGEVRILTIQHAAREREFDDA